LGAPGAYGLLMRACWSTELGARPSFSAVVHCLGLRHAELLAAGPGGAGVVPRPVLPPPPAAAAAGGEAEAAAAAAARASALAARASPAVAPAPAAAPSSGGSGLADRASSLLHVRDL
jgi:hypothetical protein